MGCGRHAHAEELQLPVGEQLAEVGRPAGDPVALRHRIDARGVEVGQRRHLQLGHAAKRRKVQALRDLAAADQRDLHRGRIHGARPD
jgi:hypothetical protein